MINAIRVSRLATVAAVTAFGVISLVGISSALKAETLTGSEATVTFDYPVEVPGKVLPPGSYVFKTTDIDEIVEVFSADQKQLFATLSVIPEDRPATDRDNNDTFIQLLKTRADAPQEIQGFFVSGRTTGFQFIYPANQVRHRRS